MAGSYPDGLNQTGFDRYWDELLDPDEDEPPGIDALEQPVQHLKYTRCTYFEQLKKETYTT